MKVKTIVVPLLLFLTLTVTTSAILQTVSAQAIKTEFSADFSWGGGGPFQDRIAGQTTHRRKRTTYLIIEESDQPLFNGTLVRIVNFNRNNRRGISMRWGTFEVVMEDVLLWKGTWTGKAREGMTTENFVGHGVGDLKGMRIKFTRMGTLGVTGFILETPN
jgi:hypothetical protein